MTDVLPQPVPKPALADDDQRDALTFLSERIAFLEHRESELSQLLAYLAEEAGSTVLLRLQFHKRRQLLHDIAVAEYQLESEWVLYSASRAWQKGHPRKDHGVNTRSLGNDNEKAARYVIWFLLLRYDQYASRSVLEEEYGMGGSQNTVALLSKLLTKEGQKSRMATVERKFLEAIGWIQPGQRFVATELPAPGEPINPWK
ncbi:hypothetical protein [Spirosoma sordidisoli]|uniref:Uncharacterized protein n=1 Tax=Spirosoma sordidisoli TaxID=2502893 RepID=A0A4Q2UKA5_9BACT|nr:hypothetical protein [Spirosoma sordidisoli]RYC69636.1 hypothetical protein EQG79_13630 [Spirosoma sordidisoli]